MIVAFDGSPLPLCGVKIGYYIYNKWSRTFLSCLVTMKKIDMNFLFNVLVVMTIHFATETAGRKYCTSASGQVQQV